MGPTFAVAREGRRPRRAGDGKVEMLEAESLLRAGRVKVYTGDLAGREADVIAGEPIATLWLAALCNFSRRAELRLAVDKPGTLYLNQGPQRHSEQHRFPTLAPSSSPPRSNGRNCPQCGRDDGRGFTAPQAAPANRSPSTTVRDRGTHKAPRSFHRER
jgi:hypothetical protein